jgi:hypothetical protein
VFVLARLSKLSALLLDFVKQLDVLDCDSGLIGERRRKFDLLIGENPHCPTHQQDYTNRYSLSEERDAEYRAIAGPSLEFRVSVFLIGKYIRDLDGFAFQ